MPWKKPTCSFYLLGPGSKSGSQEEHPASCPLGAGTEVGNAFLLDHRFSCFVDISLNRKMNQITILGIQIKTELTYQTPSWIRNQEYNILSCQSENQHSGEPPRIPECKIRIPYLSRWFHQELHILECLCSKSTRNLIF